MALRASADPRRGVLPRRPPTDPEPGAPSWPGEDPHPHQSHYPDPGPDGALGAVDTDADGDEPDELAHRPTATHDHTGPHGDESAGASAFPEHPSMSLTPGWYPTGPPAHWGQQTNIDGTPSSTVQRELQWWPYNPYDTNPWGEAWEYYNRLRSEMAASAPRPTPFVPMHLDSGLLGPGATAVSVGAAAMTALAAATGGATPATGGGTEPPSAPGAETPTTPPSGRTVATSSSSPGRGASSSAGGTGLATTGGWTGPTSGGWAGGGWEGPTVGGTGLTEVPEIPEGGAYSGLSWQEEHYYSSARGPTLTDSEWPMGPESGPGTPTFPLGVTVGGYLRTEAVASEAPTDTLRPTTSATQPALIHGPGVGSGPVGTLLSPGNPALTASLLSPILLQEGFDPDAPNPFEGNVPKIAKLIDECNEAHKVWAWFQRGRGTFTPEDVNPDLLTCR